MWALWRRSKNEYSQLPALKEAHSLVRELWETDKPCAIEWIEVACVRHLGLRGKHAHLHRGPHLLWWGPMSHKVKPRFFSMRPKALCDPKLATPLCACHPKPPPGTWKWHSLPSRTLHTPSLSIKYYQPSSHLFCVTLRWNTGVSHLWSLPRFSPHSPAQNQAFPSLTPVTHILSSVRAASDLVPSNTSATPTRLPPSNGSN